MLSHVQRMGPNDLLRQQMVEAQRNAQSLPNALSFPGAAAGQSTTADRGQRADEELPEYEAQGYRATQYQFSRQDFATYNLSCLHDPQQSHLVQLLEDPGTSKKRSLLSKKQDKSSKERLKSRTIRVCRRRELAYSAQVTDEEIADQRCTEIKPTMKPTLRQSDPIVPLATPNGLVQLHLYRGDYYHFCIPLEASAGQGYERGIRLEWRIQWTFSSNNSGNKFKRVLKGMKLGILGGCTTKVIGWFLPTIGRDEIDSGDADSALSQLPDDLREAVQAAGPPESPLERNGTNGSISPGTTSSGPELNIPANLGNLILADAEMCGAQVPGWSAGTSSPRQDAILELIREMATTSFLALYFRVVLLDTMHEKVAKYTQDGASLGRGMMC